MLTPLLVCVAACDCGTAGIHNLSPELVVSPSTLVFGTVTEPTRGLELVVQNRGAAPLLIAEAELTEDTDIRFSFIGEVETVMPETSIRWNVTFSAAGGGPATGALRIDTNDPNHPSLLVPLSANEPGAEGSPQLKACIQSSDLGVSTCDGPLSVAFGAVPLGQTRRASLVIENTGTGPLLVEHAGISSGGSPSLSAAPALSRQLFAPGAVAVVEVAFTPATTEALDAAFTITSNDPVRPTATIRVSGHGADREVPCGDIAGRICDLTGNGPAIGASVFVDAGGMRYQTTTDVQGDWSLKCVPEGTWTFTAENGSWSTTFSADIVGGQETRLEIPECLSPESARVAVVYGEWDAIEDVLDGMGVTYTLYRDAAQLVNDPAELAQYDVVFFNCGWNEPVGLRSPGLENIRRFVDDGGSIYASDLGYDIVEVGWPSYVDFDGDDSIRDDAEYGPPFWGNVDIVDSALSTAIGAASIQIDSPGAAMRSAGPQTRVYLEGDRFDEGSRHPSMISFRPSPTSGQVFYTDFHNEGQARIQDLFHWLIQSL